MGFIDWARSLFGFGKLNRESIPAGTIEKEFGVQPAASREMEDNINLWWAMYTNHPPWESCDVRPLGLPGAVGRELARHALSEFDCSISGGVRGEFLQKQMQTAAVHLGTDLELGLCLGGIAFKPYLEDGRILVDSSAVGFTPTHFDGAKTVTGGVFKTAPTWQGKEYFVRLEYHSFESQKGGRKVYVIENKAFRSSRDGSIGAQVPLNTVESWAELTPRQEIENLEHPLFSYFKPPSANDIEPESDMGVSVYSGATVDLIRQADEQWELIRWEYKSGERKVMVDRSSVKASQSRDRIFEYGQFNDPNFFQFLNPELRDDPLYNGFQRILQRIEFNAGLSYGTISDPAVVEKTATEIMAAKHRQYVTQRAIQKSLQDALDGLICAMNALCDLYRLTPSGDYETVYHWGDGILDDPETRRQDMALGLSLLSSGIISPIEYRMKYFGEDEETAQRMLPDMEGMATEPNEEIE